MRVTVVAPTWRHGEHVRQCVGSVLHGQTFRDFELVMVLDGAAEQHQQTLEWLEEHSGHPQLRVVTLLYNQGQAEAINRGMSLARGTDYLTWIHIDNLFRPRWLERMVTHLDEHPEADFCWSWCIKERGQHRHGVWCVEHQRELREASQSFLFRKRHWERVGQQRGGYAHDTDWFLRSQEQGTWIELPEVLMHRRIHPGGVSRVRRKEDDSAYWIAEARRRRGGSL